MRIPSAVRPPLTRLDSSLGASKRMRARAHGAVAVTAALLLGWAAPIVGPTSAAAAVYPEVITLPNDAVAGDVGYQPEGIVIRGSTAYVGSFADGTVVAVDLRSGRTKPLVAADGDPALGVEVAGPLLLVAGAGSGEIRVYDRRSGARLAVFDVTDEGLVNDITVAGGTAYFTDSVRAVVYALPLNGRRVGKPREIPLSGDYQLAAPGPGVFNGNGIAALNARTLLLAQTTDPDGQGSALYTVDVRTGHATRVTVKGGDVRGADGLVLKGQSLYVVQYDSNSIAELRLTQRAATATYVRTIANDALQVPTTADFGPQGRLYAVNARFGTAPSDSVNYNIVRLGR